MVCRERGRETSITPRPGFPNSCCSSLTLTGPSAFLSSLRKSSQNYSAGFLIDSHADRPTPAPHLAVGGSRLLRGTRTFRGQTHPLKPCLQLECPLLLREATPSPEGIPYVGVALQALLHEVVEVRGEGAVIGVVS